MLVYRHLVSAEDIIVESIDTDLPWLGEINGVGIGIVVQRVAGETLDDNRPVVHAGDGCQHMIQVAVFRQRVCVIYLSLIVVNMEDRYLGKGRFVNRVFPCRRGGVNVSVHRRQLKGGDGCVVVKGYFRIVVGAKT